jgi:hypothetical protein
VLAAHPNMGAGEGVQRSRVRRPMETTPPEPYYPSGASLHEKRPFLGTSYSRLELRG